MCRTELNLSPAHETIIQTLCVIFKKAGKPAYLVGGYVRNLLMGLPPADLDIASPLLPEQLKEAAQAVGIGNAKIVNPRLGTVLLEIGGEKIEHTTFRKESYAPGGGHQPESVTIGVSLQEDALRRDFAVNALYMDIFSREILDPTGRGLEDIRLRRLRSARPCAEEMIRDDALRLLRMIRFSCQLDLRIDKELFQAARRYSDQITVVSKERIYTEMNKILLSDTVYALPHKWHPVRRGILLLELVGILTRLVPEFEGYRTTGQCKYHKYHVFVHTACTAAHTPPDLTLRWAALFHDVGKMPIWKQNGRMLGHDRLGEQITLQRMQQMGADKKTTRDAAELVREHMYDLDGRTRESKLRRKIQKMGYTQFARLIQLREADFLGCGYEQLPVETAEKFRALMTRMQQEKVPMNIAELAIDGSDLIQAYGLHGKAIGEVLQALLQECLIKPSQNTRERLLRMAGRYIRP